MAPDQFLHYLRSNTSEQIRQLPLRKQSYSNVLKILPPKNENFQIKNSNIFHIHAQNIDCGYPLELPRRGGSNEYSQFMCLSRNKKNNVYPHKPQFYYIKVGFKGVKIIQACVHDALTVHSLPLVFFWTWSMFGGNRQNLCPWNVLKWNLEKENFSIRVFAVCL